MATYGFSEGDAKRIGRVVRLVERGPDKVRLSGAGGRGASPGVRLMIGTHGTSAWAKQSSKTITVYAGTPGSNGLPPASAQTVLASNIFADIGTSSSTARWAAISHNGFGWYLIAAECS